MLFRYVYFMLISTSFFLNDTQKFNSHAPTANRVYSFPLLPIYTDMFGKGYIFPGQPHQNYRISEQNRCFYRSYKISVYLRVFSVQLCVTGI